MNERNSISTYILKDNGHFLAKHSALTITAGPVLRDNDISPGKVTKDRNSLFLN